MERTLPALRLPRAAVPVWAWVYATVNLVWMALMVFSRPRLVSNDWVLWESIGPALTNGNLYSIEGIELWYVWSPILAPVMALVGIVGVIPWAVAHVAALAYLRDRLLIGLALASWAFWVDTLAGNMLTFVFVAGAVALRGSRRASLIYLTLCVLMPRPVQVPLALWLLWKMPDVRLPAAAIFMAHLFAVALSGYAVEWGVALSRTVQPYWNMQPFAFLGLAWLFIGIPLGAWLLWKGRPGWAGLAVSTYWVPTYLLMFLLDAARTPRSTRTLHPGADRR